MDDEELSRRGPQLVLGSFALTLGGLVALLDLQYFTQGTALVSSSGRDLAMLMAVIATMLGAAGLWLYRGSIAMMAVAAMIVVCGVLCVVRVVPFY